MKTRTVSSALTWRLWILAPLLALGGFTAPLWGQQAEVSGFVNDSSGGVISKATVTIQNTATNIERTTATNEAGVYTLLQLPPGVYRLTAEAPGFDKQIVEDITLQVAGKVTRTITLKVGSVSQSVVVSGSGINVNTVDAAVSTVVDRQFVENIPLNGRSFQSLLALVPGSTIVPSSGVGISGEVTVNGQRPEANYYMVDGVSANTGASTVSTGNGGGFSGNTPGQTALGTTQGMVSLDALQEFRASTSTYSAEYGRTPGGQFAFNTRSGTNNWHGSAYDYFRNDALDASNWFNNAGGIKKSEERQNDFGGTLGGPLLIPKIYNGKDKTFFFFSYEGLRLRAPQAATVTDVPSMSVRKAAAVSLQPILNAFPVPNGADKGNGLATFMSGFTNPSTMDAISVRVDHNFGDRMKLFGRYSSTPSDAQSRTASNLALVNSSTVNVKTATLGATNIFSPRFSNDLRLNVTRNDSVYNNALTNFGGATPFLASSLPGFANSPANWFSFTFSYGLYPSIWLRPLTNRQRQTNLTDSFSASLGKHNLKSGIDYRRLVNSEFLPPVITYGYLYSAAGVPAGVTDYTTLLKFNGAAKPIYTNFSAFVQDEWKVTQRLNLSLGLRWDLNPAPGDGSGNMPYTITSTDIATTKLALRGTPLWATTYGNIAPRIGVAYQANTRAGYETVLRGGFGIFYDSGNTQGSQGYNGVGFYGQTLTYGQPFPLTPANITAGATASAAAPYNALVAGFDPHLKLPRVFEWNFAVEQSLGQQQTVTVSYVGSAGRRLLVERFYYPGQSGNPNFTANAGMYLTNNQGYSDYDSLQVQFKRTLSHGLQMLSSYTWSHSLDNDSSNFAVYQLLHASSNFDVRHNFQTALTYDVPGRYSNRLASAVLRGWAFDSRISARSGFPVDITGPFDIDPSSGNYLYYQPNLVSGQPLYVDDPKAPGGRRINYAAFSLATTAAGKPAQGNAGRNLARGFSAFQTDLSLRREFHIREKWGLQFRLETFNLFNHPLFGAIYNSRSTNGPTQFGYAYNTQNSQLGGLNSLFQQGGPRSLQLALRLHF